MNKKIHQHIYIFLEFQQSPSQLILIMISGLKKNRYLARFTQINAQNSSDLWLQFKNSVLEQVLELRSDFQIPFFNSQVFKANVTSARIRRKRHHLTHQNKISSPWGGGFRRKEFEIVILDKLGEIPSIDQKLGKMIIFNSRTISLMQRRKYFLT